MKSKLLSKKSLIAVVIALAVLIGGSFLANKTVVRNRLDAMAYAKEYGQDITEDGLFIVNYEPDEKSGKVANVSMFIGNAYCINEAKVPTECKGFPTTEIEEDCFKGSMTLKKVTVPANITAIGVHAFADCKNLSEVYIPSSVGKISGNAFEKSKNVTLFVEKGSFAETFAKNNKLKYSNYTPSKADVSDSRSKNYVSEVVSDKRYKDWYYSTFYYDEKLNCAITKYVEPDGGNLDVTVPSEINGVKVTAVAQEAFMHDHNVQTVTLPDSVIGVGHDAFTDCGSLTKVIFSKNVTSIDKGIFDDSRSAKICAPKGSYAEQYAKDNGIPFEQYDKKD